MVPDATFTSYYGRPVVKASPWQADIPTYLFLGGLAAGSSLLAAGADLTGRDTLRRTGRVGAMVGITISFASLVHDLGRPTRFVNMLRVAKWTSPMSVGTWILSGYGPLAIVAGAAELIPLIRRLPAPAGRLISLLGRPSGVAAALLAPAIASYTAVLLADTATPSWHEAYRELPFVFVGSASAAAGGLGLIGACPADAGPARRLAVVGATAELALMRRMESSMGLAAEPLHQGIPDKLRRVGESLTVGGAAGAIAGRRSRMLSVVSGVALLLGSACTRFAIFYAGQDSARDPKYTIVPQRERVEARRQASNQVTGGR